MSRFRLPPPPPPPPPSFLHYVSTIKHYWSFEHCLLLLLFLTLFLHYFCFCSFLIIKKTVHGPGPWQGVHGPGPEKGSMDPWSMFCPHPSTKRNSRRCDYSPWTQPYFRTTVLSARKSLPRSRFWMSRNAPRKQTARTMRKECSSDRMSAAVLFGERCVTFKKRLRGRLSIDKRQWSASDNWVILVPRARRFFWSRGLVRVIELTPVTFVLFFQKKLKLKLKLAIFGKFEGS